MTARTPNNIIARALRKSGVLGLGQPASSDDVSDAFDDLNNMLAQWSVKRWMVFHLLDVSKVSTGAASYTVGAGGDFNVERPDRLESGFFRQIVPGGNQPIDFPMSIFQAREDYNRVALKGLASFPRYAFYDTGYPLGTLFCTPIPSASFEVHLTVKARLSQFTSVGQAINLPLEYDAALMWGLAARLRPSYQLPPDPTVTALAKDALNTIRNTNAQIPEAQIDPALCGGSGGYNIYSDRSG